MAHPHVPEQPMERGSTDSCESCSSQPGEPYSVYFGRMKGSREYMVPGGMGYEYEYEIGGRKSVLLCRPCVRGHSRNRMLSWLVFILLAVPTAITIFATAETGTISGGQALLIFLAIGLCIASLYGIYVLVSLLRIEARGEELAKQIAQPELAKQGWSSIWNSREFRELKSGSGS